MKQGYYWATKLTGIASEIVWVTGRGKKYASVYRIGYKPPFAASEFKDFEFINDGYDGYRKEGKVDEQTQSAFGPTPDEVVGCFLIEDDIIKHTIIPQKDKITIGHTPGPWIAELLNRKQSIEHWRVGNAEAGNGIVAELMDYVSFPEERDKNAALISAAPDLLAACEAIVSGSVEEARQMARLAIRKAITVTLSLDQL